MPLSGVSTPKYMSKNPRTVPSEPLDVLISQFSAQHAHLLNKLIHYFSIPLMFFAVLGIVWAIPFPHLDFLGRYNGFLNWASFLIAFTVYYYYRLSPVLSYAVLLLIFIFSAGIVGLEKLHNQSGFPEMWQACSAILILTYLAQLVGHKAEGKLPSIKYSFQTFFTGPLWVFSLLLKKSRARK